jgi:glycosyltransferase involved in cell wall biosynthesis
VTNTPGVLLASYYFPPDAAVGGLRIARFARLLPQFGRQPYVLTARDHLRDQGFDDSRLAGLEHVPVVRTGELPRVVEALSRVKGWFRRAPQQAGPAHMGPGPAAGDGQESPTAKLTRWFVSLLVLLPDEKKNWALYAAAVAVRQIRRQRIGWIVTSGPPFSGHVIGLAARVLTRARWVADFRDPWVDMLPDRFPHTRSVLSDRVERWMEAVVMSRADRVTTTTERMRQAMVARYPSLPAAKFVCIPNSIDVDSAREPIEKYGRLTITYAGVLYFERTPEPLFRAVARLVESGAASTEDIRIKLVGECQKIEGLDTMSVARRYGLEDVVEVIDRVPYPDAVRIMKRSHLLLMLAPERHRLVVPAKLFDYLGSGSAIVAIAESGATSDLMAELGCGRCFSASDVEGLADYLASLLSESAFTRLQTDPASFSRYGARYVTERLIAEMATGEAAPFRASVLPT